MKSKEVIEQKYKKVSCYRCSSNNIKKDGKRKTENRGKIQRYRCKDCNFRFVIDDGFYRMRNHPNKITAGIDLYMNGMSLRKIRSHINQFTEQGISHMQILRWIWKYSQMLTPFTQTLNPELSRIYHADEIFVKCSGQQHYFFDMIDKGTRMLVSTYYSTKRDSKSAKILFLRAKHQPLTLFTDGLQGYRKAFRRTWGRKTRKQDKQIWIRLKADVDKRNNIVERIQGTIRGRVKVMRGFKKQYSAELILNLFVVYYNFIRVHQGIGMTPAQRVGLNLDLGQNKWLGLIYKPREDLK